jgi:hypothetical protein
MFPLLQPDLQRASLHDDRRGQSLDALFAANLNRVFGAIALNALAVYALAPPWLPIRRRRRSPGTEPIRRKPARSKGRSPLGLPMGTAQMGMMISSRCS